MIRKYWLLIEKSNTLRLLRSRLQLHFPRTDGNPSAITHLGSYTNPHLKSPNQRLPFQSTCLLLGYSPLKMVKKVVPNEFLPVSVVLIGKSFSPASVIAMLISIWLLGYTLKVSYFPTYMHMTWYLVKISGRLLSSLWNCQAFSSAPLKTLFILKLPAEESPMGGSR